jgi:hypothetical protein
MTVALDDNADELSLPLNGPSCGPVDVSAWREGKFDGQPMRATVHESAGKTPGALPQTVSGRTSRVAIRDHWNHCQGVDELS